MGEGIISIPRRSSTVELLDLGRSNMYNSIVHFIYRRMAMKASVVDLRHRMRDILKALDRNETVEILYHGKVRGLLVPVEGASKKRRKVSEDPAFGMWAGREDMKDVAAYVRKLRRGRLDAL